MQPPKQTQMTPEEINQHSATALNLPRELILEHNWLMTIKMTKWPDELYGFVRGRLYGKAFCGALLSEAVAEWLILQTAAAGKVTADKDNAENRNTRTIELRLTIDTTDEHDPGWVFEEVQRFLESSGYGEVVEGSAGNKGVSKPMTPEQIKKMERVSTHNPPSKYEYDRTK